LLFNTRSWYDFQAKPIFALPILALAPVHLLCLIFAGLAATIVLGNVSGNPAVGPARISFSIWLTIHGIWILLFAGFHFPILGLGVAIIQWGVSVYCIQKFYNVDPKAGFRAIPFFFLTSYWMLVNGGILSMNNY